MTVGFQVDVAGSGDAGPLKFIDDNTDQNCGWLNPVLPGPFKRPRPHMRGKDLAVTQPGTALSGPACVLRLDFPVPLDNNVERTGHFNFIFQAQCVDRTVAPCNHLTEQPTVAHPATVRWSPSPFYVAACGRARPPGDRRRSGRREMPRHVPLGFYVVLVVSCVLIRSPFTVVVSRSTGRHPPPAPGTDRSAEQPVPAATAAADGLPAAARQRVRVPAAATRLTRLPQG